MAGKFYNWPGSESMAFAKSAARARRPSLDKSPAKHRYGRYDLSYVDRFVPVRYDSVLR